MSVSSRSLAWYFFALFTICLFFCANACSTSGDDSLAAGAAGSGGAAGHGGAASGGRSGSSGAAGPKSAAGAPELEAGAGGQGGRDPSAGTAGEAEAGAGGAPLVVDSCQSGGSVFVVGSYVNAAGDEVLLRATASAATVAFVPKAPAVPAKPPQLFLVERFCKAGDAFIASDGISHFRVDFVQNGGSVALCMSAPVATLELAAELTPADITHKGDTGCAGKPFGLYATEIE